MYNEVHYAVKLPEGLTQMVSSKVALKQGGILSPTLVFFTCSINDLADTFDSSCKPVELNKKKLSCLLYADDIVLMSDSACGLQSCINKLELFCNKWNLSVNLDKTNVMIFNKSGCFLKNMSFHLGTTRDKTVYRIQVSGYFI